MPFQSESQRRYLWSQHPEIARRWANEEKNVGKKEAIGRRLKKHHRDGATDHSKNTMVKPAKKPWPGLQMGVDKKSPVRRKG